MSGRNLSGVYNFYTMAVTATTMVKIYLYHSYYGNSHVIKVMSLHTSPAHCTFSYDT